MDVFSELSADIAEWGLMLFRSGVVEVSLKVLW
jgi:hypothetical protein